MPQTNLMKLIKPMSCYRMKLKGKYMIPVRLNNKMTISMIYSEILWVQEKNKKIGKNKISIKKPVRLERRKTINHFLMSSMHFFNRNKG